MVASGLGNVVPLSGSPHPAAVSGATSPAAILSSVDLPDPLRPTRHTRSPAETSRSTPSSSGVPPKVSAMPLSWSSGAAISTRLDHPPQLPDGLIEFGEERGAVARREGRRPPGQVPGFAQVSHEIAHGERHADR